MELWHILWNSNIWENLGMCSTNQGTRSTNQGIFMGKASSTHGEWFLNIFHKYQVEFGSREWLRKSRNVFPAI